MMTSKSQSIRQSVIAGSWYPGTEKGLARTVDDYLASVDQPQVAGKLLGLLSPHAGYIYSGQTAAYAFRQLRGRPVDTVVLIGPSHRAWVGDYAVSSEDAYETPLGRVPLDREFLDDLNNLVALRFLEGDVEHSLEIQLPFLQREVGEFKLAPILMSADAPAVAEQLATALSQIVSQREEKGKHTVMVASSDLHHIENYDEVVRRDQKVIDAIAAYDLDHLAMLLTSRACSVCGRMPILTVLHAARSLGADAVKILHHTNSGDVTGQRWKGQYTVGYMAAAVYESQPESTKAA